MRGKRDLSEADKRSFRLTNDPRQYEKETFVERINEIKFALKEFQKLHEKASVTDHLYRAKVLKQIERSERILSKTQVDMRCLRSIK
jgi:hypothetical protein